MCMFYGNLAQLGKKSNSVIRSRTVTVKNWCNVLSMEGVTFLNVCPFDYTAVAGSGTVGPVNQVNHTSWVAVVTQTDRPKSVRNRWVIELFVALFVLSLCPFDISLGAGAFLIGLSQISSFFSFSLGEFIWYHLCTLLRVVRNGKSRKIENENICLQW